jgi:hypothetical protein
MSERRLESRQAFHSECGGVALCYLTPYPDYPERVVAVTPEDGWTEPNPMTCATCGKTIRMLMV